MTEHTIGIDTAKDVFHLITADGHGRPNGRRKLRRNKLAGFIAQQPRARIYLEACGGSHHWARRFEALGHEVHQIAPQFVKKYRTSDKNDYNDAAACIEAGLRPKMRYVGTKTVEQQTLQSYHTARELAKRQRNALGNYLRGVLREFGIVVAQSNAALRRRLPEIMEDGENELTMPMRELLAEEYRRWRALCDRLDDLEREIERLARQQPLIRRLVDELAGVGWLTGVALWTAVGDVSRFAQGRQFAALVGVIPRQHSTGDQPRLLGIRKGGHNVLRASLVHGARSAIRALGDKSDLQSEWLRALVARRGFNRAAVALANKNARQAWAIMSQGA